MYHAKPRSFNFSVSIKRSIRINKRFKGFTSKKIVKIIDDNPQESRKEWMLWMFERAGKKNSNVTNKQFWQQDNKPIEIWSLNVFEQKLKYIPQLARASRS